MTRDETDEPTATSIDETPETAAKRRRVEEAAARALAEADARRAESEQDDRPREFGGRDGPEPTRFGDWEKDGVTSDF